MLGTEMVAGQKYFASPPSCRPQALVREGSQYAYTHRTKCPILDKRHACRMLGTEMLAGKSYFGKTGRKRVSIAACVPSAHAAPQQCAQLVVPTKALT